MFAKAICIWMAGVCIAAPPLAAASSRIHARIEQDHDFVLRGNVHPLASPDYDQGEADPSLELPHITVHFAMTPEQASDLQNLLRAQQDPANANYHQWLAPEEFADRFGLGHSDLRRIVDWLHAIGFRHIKPARGRLSVSMAGTGSQAAQAFATAIHLYQVGDTVHYANATAPALPEALKGVVVAITGLDDFAPQPRLRSVKSMLSASPKFTFGPDEYAVSPADFAVIYDVKPLYDQGFDGTGQTIAVAGASDVNLSTIAAFRTAAGLPPSTPKIVVPTGSTDPGFTDAEDEGEIDLMWAGAVARGANIVYVNSKNAFDSLAYALDQNLASVVSFSFGSCEGLVPQNVATAYDQALQQGNAQGITVVVASGDAGPAGCDDPFSPTAGNGATHGLSADFPAGSPSVTGMGGTMFSDSGAQYWSAFNGANWVSALSYIPETTWNPGQPAVRSGGGVSKYFSKPSWQLGDNVPADNARDVPDLALLASSYLTCKSTTCTNGFTDATGHFYLVGGTSLGAPTFAGVVAITNQFTNNRQGNVNPRLYTLAGLSSDIYHDITTGDNIVPCQIGSTPDCVAGTFGYQAGPGYDLVTGLGSIDIANLVEEWAPDFELTAPQATIGLPAQGSATATIHVAARGRFTGSVSFTCTVDTALSNTTCSIPGTVTGSGDIVLNLNHGTQTSQILPFIWTGGVVLGLLLLRQRCSGGTYERIALRPAWLAVSAMLLFTVACGDGGGSSGSGITQQFVPPPITGNVTVTAQSTATTLSPALAHSVTVTVSIPQ